MSLHRIPKGSSYGVLHYTVEAFVSVFISFIVAVTVVVVPLSIERLVRFDVLTGTSVPPRLFTTCFIDRSIKRVRPPQNISVRGQISLSVDWNFDEGGQVGM